MRLTVTMTMMCPCLLLVCLLATARSARIRHREKCPPLDEINEDLVCDQCSTAAAHNTTVTLGCKERYRLDTPAGTATVTCGRGGRWSGQIPSCKPQCGLSNLKATRELAPVGRRPARTADFPWHAALYVQTWSGEWEHACGGTLISTRHVLTAGRCVTWRGCEDCPPEVLRAPELRVSLGNLRPQWSVLEDTEVRRAVHSVHVYTYRHRHDSGDFGDIAMLTLDAEVEVSSAVWPVCLDHLGVHYRHMTTTTPAIYTAYVAGWGTDVNCIQGDGCDDTPSDTLHYEVLPVAFYIDCFNSILDINRTHYPRLSYDQICTLDNKEARMHGDTGSGLVYKADDKYYILGVASTRITQDTKVFSTFTNVNEYDKWISDMVLGNFCN